jgi:hypothetical protein
LYRQGRYDRGARANARWCSEVQEVFAALDALDIKGDVLELAPGTGIWIERPLRSAASIGPQAFYVNPRNSSGVFRLIKERS